MGWLLISSLISILAMLATYLFGNKKAPDWDDIRTTGMMAFGIALIFIGGIAGVVGSIESGKLDSGDDPSHCEASVNQWPIISAVREQTVSGSFILGTGGVNTVDRYYAYQQEDKGLMLTTYRTYKTYVVEYDGEPKYERIDYYCPRPFYDFMWFGTGNTKYNKGREGTLYVPKGTILREFRL